MFRELLTREFAPFGSLSSGQLDALEAHYRLMMRWNERINLTRIRKLEDIVRFHYCESLFLASKLPPGPFRVADIGSGAGFPGLPLGIFRPDLEVTLVESHRRKAVFLTQASAGLENIKVVPVRAEELKSHYDWVVSRAVVSSEVISLSLATDYALLIAEADLIALPHSRAIFRVPWGANRMLVMFHVEHDTI